jgi:beta-lactam-binding protein with PASTA domain
MTITGLDGIVDEYLHRLGTALTPLPVTEREQIVAEITEHITQARASLPTQNEAAVRGLLDRLGDPEVIAAVALADAGPQEVMPRGPVRPRRRTVLVAAGVVVLIFAAFGAYLAQQRPSSVTVPNVVGEPMQVAVNALAAAGLKQGSIGVVPSASVPSNVVISMSPAAGATARSGTQVNLAISQGPSTMPDVVGRTNQAATSDLAGRGLRVVDVRVHGSQARGTVVAQSPSQGTKLARESWVRIDVVNNSGAVAKTVPNVAFMPAGYAIEELRSLGIKIRHVHYVRWPIPGVIVGQTTAGTPVPTSGIYLAVSKRRG